jgi:hypothetical protein
MIKDLDINVALSPDKFNPQIGQEFTKVPGSAGQLNIWIFTTLPVQKKEKLIYGYENNFGYDLTEMKNASIIMMRWQTW